LAVWISINIEVEVLGLDLLVGAVGDDRVYCRVELVRDDGVETAIRQIGDRLFLARRVTVWK
jgi:hypothetical protein